jgi:hypothetical protein
MPATRHITPRTGDVLLFVGTMKGLFLFRAGRKRGKWEMGGPYFPGSAVYAVALDGRAGRHRIWAGPHSTATCLPLRRAGLGAGAVAAAFTMAQKIGRLAPPPAPRSPGRERRAVSAGRRWPGRWPRRREAYAGARSRDARQSFRGAARLRFECFEASAAVPNPT